MKKIILIIATMAAAFIAARPAHAQEAKREAKEGQPLQEVFQTELVYPQEKGEVQLTVSPSFSKDAGGNRFLAPLTLEYGLTDRWQVELEWGAATFRPESGDGNAARGMGDLRLGTKYSFMDMRGSEFHSAVGLEVGLPTGSVGKGLSEGVIEYEPYFILARDFPRLNGTQLFAQVGVSLLQRVKGPASGDEDEPAAHEFSLSAGAFVPVRRLVLTGEVTWQTNRWNQGGTESRVTFTPGVVWRPFSTWEVGVGVPLGLTPGADKFGNILKLTYEF